MSRPFIRRPRTVVAPALLWLLVLAVCARALVPLGYMPDGAALRDGRLALTLCTASGPVPFAQAIHAASAAHPADHGHNHDHGAAHHDHHGAAHHDHDHGASHVALAGGAHAHGAGGHDHGDTAERAPSCPFWLAAHSFLFLSDAGLSPLTAQLAALPRAVLPAQPVIRPAPAGPPLGSRAPPFLRT